MTKNRDNLATQHIQSRACLSPALHIRHGARRAATRATTLAIDSPTGKEKAR